MGSRGARRSLMDSFGPVQSMPPTAWRTKTGTPNPTPKPVFPNDLPVVRRLSSSASLPDVLAHKLPQAPNRRDVREIRAALGTASREAQRIRALNSRLRWQLIETQRERLEDHRRERSTHERMRSKVTSLQIDDFVAKQFAARERMQPLRAGSPSSHQLPLAPSDRLSADQELALKMVFDRATKVYDTADGAGKVALDELDVVLRALGYSDEEAQAVTREADAHGGGGFAAELDGEARLNATEFLSVIAHAPAKPTEVRTRLSSMGKLLREVRLQEEEAAAEHSFARELQPSAAYLAARERARTARSIQIDELRRDAFPFSIVADSHRIGNLVRATTTIPSATRGVNVNSWSPNGSPRRGRRRSPRRAKKVQSPANSPPKSATPTNLQKAAAVGAMWRFKARLAGAGGAQ